MEQKELFEKVRVDTGRMSLPLSILYLSFTFMFAVLAFLVYLFWDFGIAGRVVLFFTLLLTVVHVAIYIAKCMIDSIGNWRK